MLPITSSRDRVVSPAGLVVLSRFDRESERMSYPLSMPSSLRDALRFEEFTSRR
jgi:hypothetical protein